MKFQGIKIEKPKPLALVVPHDGHEIVFQAELVDNYDEFDELVERPKPPKIMKAGGKEEVDFQDKDYLAAVNEWSDKRSNWMFIKSLSATKELEWEVVDPKDPNTWNKLDEELKSSGFSGPVIERIKMLVFKACGLDQGMIDEATERFLAGRAQESSNESSQNSEQ